MGTFGEFIAKLEEEYPEPSSAGTAIEPFIRDALLASPSHQFEEAWLWDDWPGRDGPEHGIDIVARDGDGHLWGIQSKYSSNPEKNLTWGPDKISHWAGSVAGPKWDFGLLVSNCAGIDEHVEREVLQNPKLKLLIAGDLHDLRVDWPEELHQPTRQKTRYDPLPHQVQAIQAITDGFDQGAERLQVHMACGTGKTFTALWTYQYIQPDLALVLVPSLSLMTQTIREWTANTSVPFRFLSVCSDPKIAVEHLSDEEEKLHLGDLTVMDSPATTNPDSIKEFISRAGPKVIFSTYQSSPLVADATAGDTSFGLVICDEAHRTATDRTSIFATVLDDRKITAERRLFMTATPRVFVQSAKGDEISYSMDNEDVFGEVAFQLGFGDAVDLGLLADFEVAVIAITDPKVRALVDGGNPLELEGIDKKIQSPSLLALEATLLALKKYGISRMLSFHSRVNRAQDFASALSAYSDWRNSDLKPEALNISGFMNAPTRKNRLQWLEKASNYPKVLTNARCLNEGVDVPALDGVLFADPRKSQLDIVQAVGRVMRRDPDNPDKVGRIIVPVVVPKASESEADNVFEDSSFKPLWDVVRALKAHDFRLEDQLRKRRGKGSIGSELEPEEDSGDSQNALPIRTIGIDDVEKLELAIVKKATSNFWWWLNGPLAQYYERTGGFPKHDWIETFEGAEVKLGVWCHTQRSQEKVGQLAEDRVLALEAAGFTWSERNRRRTVDDDEKFIFALELFKEEKGHAWPDENDVVEGVELATEVRRMNDILRGAPNQPRYTAEQVRGVLARVHERWNNIRAVFPEYPERVVRSHELQKASRIAELAMEIKSMSTSVRERELEDHDFAEWCDEVRIYISNKYADQVPQAAIALLRDTQGWEEARLRQWKEDQKAQAEQISRLTARASFLIYQFLSEIEPDLFGHLVAPMDSTIIEHRFNPEKEPETLQQVGKRLSVTRERIRQREKQIRYNGDHLPFTFSEDELKNLSPNLGPSFQEELSNRLELISCTDLELREFSANAKSNALAHRLRNILSWLDVPGGMLPKQVLVTQGHTNAFWTGTKNTTKKEDHARVLKIWDDAVSELVTTTKQRFELTEGVPQGYPVQDLPLRERTLNCLRYARIATLGELLKLSDSELLRIRNFGSLSLEDVKNLQNQIQSGELVLGGPHLNSTVIPKPPSPWETLDALWAKGIRNLDDLELSTAITDILKREGIDSLKSLLETTNDEILQIKYFGTQKLNEVRRVLGAFGIALPSAEASPQPLDETSSVSRLGCSVRVNNILQRLHISTVGQLFQTNVEELMQQTNFGETSLNDLTRQLRAHRFPDLHQTSHSEEKPAAKQVDPPPHSEEKTSKHIVAPQPSASDLPFSEPLNWCLQRHSLTNLEAVSAASDQHLLNLSGFKPSWLYKVRKVTHPGEVISKETAVARLDFPPHVLSALKGLLSSRFNTVGELSKASDEDLLAIKFLGKPALQTLDEILNSVGFTRNSNATEQSEEETDTSGSSDQGAPLLRTSGPSDSVTGDTNQESPGNKTQHDSESKQRSLIGNSHKVSDRHVFPNRIRSCLRANGLRTVASVRDSTDEELLSLKAFSARYLSTVRSITHPGQKLEKSMHVGRLPLGRYAGNGIRSLLKASISTIGQLCDLTDSQLLSIKGINAGSIEAIDEAFRTHGLARPTEPTQLPTTEGNLHAFPQKVQASLRALGLTTKTAVQNVSDEELLRQPTFPAKYLAEVRTVTHPHQKLRKSMHIGRLSLDAFAANGIKSLLEASVETIGDLCNLTDAELLNIRGISVATMEALDRALKANHLARPIQPPPVSRPELTSPPTTISVRATPDLGEVTKSKQTQNNENLVRMLKDLAVLHSSGQLTTQEFNQAKTRLLEP